MYNAVRGGIDASIRSTGKWKLSYRAGLKQDRQEQAPELPRRRIDQHHI